MPLSTKEIYEFYYTASCDPKPPSASKLIHAMLIASLAPKQKRIYQLVYDAGRNGVTAREISEKLKLSVNSASNALKEMYDMDLMFRSEAHNESGLYYVYKIHA